MVRKRQTAHTSITRCGQFDAYEEGAEEVYTEEEFERIMEEADSPFALTDGVLYFTEVDYDMKWLITQV